MLKNGTLTKPIDIFDLFYHLIPTTVLGLKIYRNTCKKKKPRSQINIKYDGIIRIQREVKGRKGKTVTTLSGFQINDAEL